ncbi:MAG: phytanoyl-CoA dioxygenase family protein [Acidimicrobiia bacterium]|nr:phytanoyl-CoA dioxygenase family protein [Acidimicrobiia bacterium]
MPVEHLDRDASPADIAAVIARDGCAVVDELADPAALEALRAEIEPFVDATPYGPDDFSGTQTRRTGGLIGRAPSSRAFVMHPTVTGTVDQVLGHATNWQLHLTQIIAIGPGGEAQAVHRDQWAFDFFPFPAGYEVQCNTIWAMTDFTEHNGATRVVVGSHTDEDRKQFTFDHTEPAEMRRGSVLFYTGALYHGGGPNRSDVVRWGLNITYNVAWLRQEENQYLSTPLEVARELDEDLLRVMGYARGAYALGYIDDLRDPIEAVLGSATAAAAGFGDDGPPAIPED